MRRAEVDTSTVPSTFSGLDGPDRSTQTYDELLAAAAQYGALRHPCVPRRWSRLDNTL